MSQEYVMIEDMVFSYDTKDAYLFEDEDGEGYWIPKSQVEFIEPECPRKGDVVRFEIPEWLAAEKGLI